jgi:hypothetical protein
MAEFGDMRLKVRKRKRTRDSYNINIRKIKITHSLLFVYCKQMEMKMTRLFFLIYRIYNSIQHLLCMRLKICGVLAMQIVRL